MPIFGGLGENFFGGGIGSAGGYQSPFSASNQASSLSLQEYLDLVDSYNTKITNSQREINQDFFNQAMAFNANQAQIDRDRQDNAYQIMVRDLEKAGLNKLLAYNNSPQSISSMGASVGTPSSSRGSDLTSALTSLANTNANKVGGFLGAIVQLVFGLASSIGSIVDITNSKK